MNFVKNYFEILTGWTGFANLVLCVMTCIFGSNSLAAPTSDWQLSAAPHLGQGTESQYGKAVDSFGYRALLHRTLPIIKDIDFRFGLELRSILSSSAGERAEIDYLKSEEAYLSMFSFGLKSNLRELPLANHAILSFQLGVGNSTFTVDRRSDEESIQFELDDISSEAFSVDLGFEKSLEKINASLLYGTFYEFRRADTRAFDLSFVGNRSRSNFETFYLTDQDEKDLEHGIKNQSVRSLSLYLGLNVAI